MRYIEGEDRTQGALFPERLDDFIGDDHPVRVIDAFVDCLDLAALGFRRAHPAATGRPAYHPGDMLKLYVYGYLNQVRSSRRLERESLRNIELLWLLKRLSPDFKTIADFRKDNGAAIRRVCREFVLFCREQELFASRLVAIDGSKFQAAASPKRVIGQREVTEGLERLDRRIAEYLEGFNDKDDDGSGPDGDGDGRVALEALRERRAELAALGDRLEAEGRSTLTDGEPEARKMRMSDGRKVPAYNVQTAVDSRSHLILHHDVTEEATDNRQLAAVAFETRSALGGGDLEVVADAGYSNGEMADACEKAGIVVNAPANRSINNHGDFFEKSAFTYDSTADSYTCPAGEALPRKTYSSKDKLYLYTTDGCGQCALKSKCTKAKKRWVTRHFFEEALLRMNQRVRDNPALMTLRRATAEHPFGTIKRMTNGGRFLTRGMENVKTETALSILSYNMLRAINILGVRNMIAALR